MSVQTVARLCAPLLGLILLGQMIFAPASMARTLHVGAQSVPLTSDKRSSPALALRMPAGDVWYGFLVSGTVAGRLTVQMPSGIFSLIAPSNHTFSTIQADFPQIYTWDQTFLNNFPRWGNQNVWWTANHNNNLSATLGGHAPIWSNFHIQATCSATTGTYPHKGNPVLPNVANGNTAFASTVRQCWCRLKQRADGANGGWVFGGTFSTAALCAFSCPDGCANAAGLAAFRAVLFDAFENL
ncbi:MAG: hypothetical protein FWE17_01510 [Alphaproteobacteria bacterium]|nr:hypothetical protein [Alphaproteobacteria bacterium]MCL2757826.1 hypothetical protein [Alphaproteobacteria bacterium]